MGQQAWKERDGKEGQLKKWLRAQKEISKTRVSQKCRIFCPNPVKSRNHKCTQQEWCHKSGNHKLATPSLSHQKNHIHLYRHLVWHSWLAAKGVPTASTIPITWSNVNGVVNEHTISWLTLPSELEWQTSTRMMTIYLHVTPTRNLYNTGYDFSVFIPHDTSPQRLCTSKCYLALRSNLSRRANSQNLTRP